MNVYFVNCLLACALAYIIGWIMAKRSLEHQFKAALANVIDNLSRAAKKASVTSDVNLH